MHTLRNLRDFLELLRSKNELQVIDVEVDPYLEIAEIHRRVIERQGPALLFTKVKDSAFPVVTNLFGKQSRLDLAFGTRPRDFVRQLVHLVEHSMPPTLSTLWQARGLMGQGLRVGLKQVKTGPILERVQEPCRLGGLPMLTSWHSDGGPFVTLPLVYTEDPGGNGHNLGMYRIQRYDETTTGIHWQIHKGGGYHYFEAERRNQALPATLFIGGPPALMLAAIAPLPENLPELMLASLLQGSKLHLVADPKGGHPLIAEAEFAIKGVVPPFERRPEGPFGDHYGYNSLQHDYPVFHTSHLYHRKDAIYPATVVGRPKQEDYFIGDFLQELLSPLFPLVMKGVVQLKTFGEAGFHCLAAARVSERYPREAFAAGLRILGEGQLSLTKFLLLTDGSLDMADFTKVWQHILERIQWDQDLFVFANVSQDTLDYTGPAVNSGSKAMMLGLGREKRRDLAQEFHGNLPPGCSHAKVYLPGTLVVQGADYAAHTKLGQELASWEGLGNWPVVILVDDSAATTVSLQEFLWTMFTRFEPAADIYGCRRSVHRFHVGLEAPIVFDCRMKPWYTEILEVDQPTKARVDALMPKIANL